MAAELKSGSMLGPYELLVRLGRGGMASVWVARETAPGGAQRLVAVKAMLPELLRRSNFRAMFLEEGQIVRAIDHPNVVKVHEVSEDHGSLYMAMEWVEGDSLRTIIKEARRRRPIPSEMAVKIIADAAAGLHAAHELRGWDGELRNVVHCDVSPHNILVGLDGRAKLVDFGVANATAHADVAAEDRIKGKFGYMSPEQARAEKLDRRSDVFALGIVLFELLTGERLFRGENAAHSLELVKKGPIPNPAELNPKLSPKLVSIVKKALERDLRRRYQTAAQLGEALERYLVEERVMVSHASLGHLVRRVLGTRIENQRQAVREALTVSDGVVAAGLVPDHPTSSEHSHGHFASSGHFAVNPSEPPSSSSSSSTSTPHPQALAPRRRGASILPVLATIAGLSAAAGAIWFVNNQPPTPLPAPHASTAPANKPQSKPAPDAYWQEPGPWGVNVDSIPLAATEAEADRGKALHAGKAPEASVHAAKPAPRSDKPDKPDKPEPSAPMQVELKDDVPASIEAPKPAPEAARPAKAPPAEERTPLNRASAATALSSAASSAASCRREGGPSGAGSASVTFSPEGQVSSVSLAAPFAGTPVGACVQGLFRGAHVPAFSGSAVTLSKSFRVPD